MTTQIPIICDTLGCGTIWFSNSIFNIGIGATVHSQGNRVSSCPKCKGSGHIPDGVYTHTSATLFNPSECNLILSAIRTLQEKVAAGATTDVIKQEIKQQFPFLSALTKFIPKDSAQLAAWVAILVMVFLHYSKSKDSVQPPSVHVELNVSKALEQVSSDLKTILQNNQEQNKEHQKDKNKKDVDSSVTQE